MSQLRVNDVDLFYMEQGTGVPAVFVHGVISDSRYWEPQRQAVATRYRFLAYDYRYHGTAPWPDEGEYYSYAIHAADLEAFIRRLATEPVHLVGLSGGGRVAALVALQYPELVRSLTLAEPALHELLVNLPRSQPARDEWTKVSAPIGTALEAGDIVQATKLFFECGNNLESGAFDTQPEALRQMFLDNARTLLLSSSAPTPPAISCAMLESLKVPTLVLRGEHTLQYFSLISEVVAECIPRSHLVVIPKATHIMSYQNPSAFNDALLHFLTQQNSVN